MGSTKVAKERMLETINEWLNSINEISGVKHEYECEFNRYRLFVNIKGNRIIASCDYDNTTKFFNFINDLWIYYNALTYKA